MAPSGGRLKSPTQHPGHAWEGKGGVPPLPVGALDPTGVPIRSQSTSPVGRMGGGSAACSSTASPRATHTATTAQA